MVTSTAQSQRQWLTAAGLMNRDTDFAQLRVECRFQDSQDLDGQRGQTQNGPDHS